MIGCTLAVIVTSPRAQRFNGKGFYKAGRYFKAIERCTANHCGWRSILLHRAVWEYHHGAIPTTHHVHHKDGNTDNNQIENLDCVPKGQHLQQHMTPERRAAQGERIRNNPDAYLKAAAWHRSADGREWHRQHALRLAAKPRRPETIAKMSEAQKRRCADPANIEWRRMLAAGRQRSSDGRLLPANPSMTSPLTSSIASS